MSTLLSTPIADFTFDYIRQFCAQQNREHSRLEYKKKFSSRCPAKQIGKEVSAMANTRSRRSWASSGSVCRRLWCVADARDNIAFREEARVDAAQKRPGPAVSEASGVGLAHWCGKTSAIHGDGGRFGLYRAGRLDRMAIGGSAPGKCRRKSSKVRQNGDLGGGKWVTSDEY